MNPFQKDQISKLCMQILRRIEPIKLLPFSAPIGQMQPVQAILLLVAATYLVDNTQASSLRITHYHNDWTVDTVSSAMRLCRSFGSLAWSSAEARPGPVSMSQTRGTDKCALACVRFRALTGWHIGALRHANGVGERRFACYRAVAHSQPVGRWHPRDSSTCAF